MWSRRAAGDRGGGGGSGEKRGGWVGAGAAGETWSEDDERGEEKGRMKTSEPSEDSERGAEAVEAGGGWGMGECEHARVLVGRIEVDYKYLAVLEHTVPNGTRTRVLEHGPSPQSTAKGGSRFNLPASLESRADGEAWWAQGHW